MEGAEIARLLIYLVLGVGITGIGIKFLLKATDDKAKGKDKPIMAGAIITLLGFAMLATPLYFDVLGINDIEFGFGDVVIEQPETGYITTELTGVFQYRNNITKAIITSDPTSGADQGMFIMGMGDISNADSFNFWGTGVRPAGFTTTWNDDAGAKRVEVSDVFGGTSYYRIFKNTTTGLTAGGYYTAYDTSSVTRRTEAKDLITDHDREWFSTRYFEMYPVGIPEILFVGYPEANYSEMAEVTFTGQVRSATNEAQVGAPLHETRLYITSPDKDGQFTYNSSDGNVTWSDIDLTNWTLDKTRNLYYMVIPEPLVRYNAIGQNDTFSFDIKITNPANWAAEGNSSFAFTSAIRYFDREGVVRSSELGEATLTIAHWDEG